MSTSFKRIKPALLAIGLFVSVLLPLLNSTELSALSGTDFDAGRIIDDSIFYNKSTMTPQDIQSFFEAKVPKCNSTSPGCLRDYIVNIGSRAPDQYCSGGIEAGTKIAAQILWDVSQACNVNPQSLIVLLQKEQGLVTSTNPTPTMYAKATGFACPDTAACDTEYAGLYNQLFYAARQFQRYAKLPNNYGHRAGRNNTVLYNPSSSCGSGSVYIVNQATAGLYNYTPYQPNQAALANLYGTGDNCSSYGNRNFWRFFTDWFGSTNDGRCYNGSTSTSKSDVLLKDNGRIAQAVFALNGDTGSGCVEFHGWNAGFRSWDNHLPSNMPTVDTATNQLSYADLDGDGNDEAILIGLAGTGSGSIEFHVWNYNYKTWKTHIASNAPTINPGVSSVHFADVDGDGRDEGLLIGQGNGSTSTGKIEFHVWNPGFGTWRDHIISNSSTLDPAVSSIKFADVDGDGRDEGLLIGQGNGSTSTGKIEFHVWNPGFGTWRDHIISNSSTLDPAVSSILFGDFNGDRRDEGILVGKKSPTGSGQIEFHIWNAGLTSWKDHIVSNQAAPSS